MGNVVRDNAEALRQLALAPAAPTDAKLAGAVTPDAKVSWSAEDDPERLALRFFGARLLEPRWQVYDFVPSAGQTVLKGVSTDNHFCGARGGEEWCAFDRGGHGN